MASSRVRPPRVHGSRATGYHCEGAHFYIWEPDRPDALGWGRELATLDSQISSPHTARRDVLRGRPEASDPARAGS